MADFIVKVFGKEGCDKCKVLNRRIDNLLGKKEWAGFAKAYFDVETEEGLVDFCNVECINPQRIPAMVVARIDEETGRPMLLQNPRMGESDPICEGSKLYTYLGLQTDYAAGGVLTPKMISSVLKEARQLGA